jgi:hypothetical protein
MKKQVWIFGSIAGLIVSTFMAISMAYVNSSPGHEGSYVVGFGSMIVAFAFIYVGIRNYRDKTLGGMISFGKAFKLGLLIALVASTFYVVTWVVEYNLFMPDFMDKYTSGMMQQAEKRGASAAEMAEMASEMDGYKEMYRNPVLMVLLTYTEILPVGLIVALISAAILRRKQPRTQNVVA